MTKLQSTTGQDRGHLDEASLFCMMCGPGEQLWTISLLCHDVPCNLCFNREEELWAMLAS
jgi:hypothetical protein